MKDYEGVRLTGIDNSCVHRPSKWKGRERERERERKREREEREKEGEGEQTTTQHAVRGAVCNEMKVISTSYVYYENGVKFHPCSNTSSDFTQKDHRAHQGGGITPLFPRSQNV